MGLTFAALERKNTSRRSDSGGGKVGHGRKAQHVLALSNHKSFSEPVIHFTKWACALIPVISGPHRGEGRKEVALGSFFCAARKKVRTTPDLCKHQKTHTSTPFLVEMSLARSSLRLALESGFSSERGRAFSWGAERLCRTWDSSKRWLSALKTAAGHTHRAEEPNVKTLPGLIGFWVMPYLQRERGWNDGPPRGAERRRGARSSRCTGLPARHTRTAPQSSKTNRGGKKVKDH